MTRLEQLRLDAALTPEQLADRVHVAPMTIRRIEAGKRSYPSTLEKIAHYFHVPASDLVREALPVTSSRSAA